MTSTEQERIVEAISMVKNVMLQDRGLTDITVDTPEGRQSYRIRDDILSRSSRPLEGDNVSGADLQAFAREAILVVQVLRANAERNIEEYRRALQGEPISLSEEDKQLLAKEPRGDYTQVDHEVLTELNPLSVEVPRALDLYAYEDALATVVLHQAAAVAEREGKSMREAGVPEITRGLSSLASGYPQAPTKLARHWAIRAAVDLLANRDVWESRYETELFVNRMLKAVAQALTGVETGQRFGYHVQTRKWVSTASIGAADYVFAREAQFAVDREGTLCVVPVGTEREASPYAVKDGSRTRDDQAVDGLLGGMAFALVSEAFARVNGRIERLYALLSLSALYGDDERAQVAKYSIERRQFRGGDSWRKVVTAETIEELESLSATVGTMRADAEMLVDHVTQHADQIAATLREGHDNGEGTVRLEQGYEIQTITEAAMVEPTRNSWRRILAVGTRRGGSILAPRQARVVVDTGLGNEPVEAVAWQPRDLAAAQALVERSRMLGLAATGPALTQT